MRHLLRSLRAPQHTALRLVGGRWVVAARRPTVHSTCSGLQGLARKRPAASFCDPCTERACRSHRLPRLLQSGAGGGRIPAKVPVVPRPAAHRHAGAGAQHHPEVPGRAAAAR